MVELPSFTTGGDLPSGVYPLTLREAMDQLGSASVRRTAIASRLERIYGLAAATGELARFIVFGSFVTAEIEPNDIDIFMLMENTFDAGRLVGDARLLFDHAAAQAHLGASVFWLRRLAALGGEQETIEHWQVTRSGRLRGIVEIIGELP